MSAKLPVLAEIGAPASSNGRAWGLRRGDLEAPARAFAEAVARAAPSCEVVVLRPGESFNHP